MNRWRAIVADAAGRLLIYPIFRLRDRRLVAVFIRGIGRIGW